MGSLATSPPSSITVHSRTYNSPSRPTVVICIDGFDPTYLLNHPSNTPNLTRFTDPTHGFHATAHCAIPSLTNPNNLCIITGAPTKLHGVSGNYYLDKTTGEEVMMVDDRSMWGTTILAELASQLNVRVAAITAKDKLRRIINHGLNLKNGAICFSAQFADQTSLAENGIENVEAWLGQRAPEQYSGELSLFVLDAGLKLLKEGRADLFYLTLSDYIQHKHAPEEPEALKFMAELDRRIGELVQLGALVVMTGDHGMSAKSDPSTGEPNVLFLEDVLREKWPQAGARVICPIADPFVKHHGALGGFVRVHLLNTAEEDKDGVVKEMLDYVRTLPEVEVAYAGAEAAKCFEMPVEREGEMVVVSKKNAVLGGRQDEHDLSGLKGHRLRSHGGLSEQEIPILRSEPLTEEQLRRVEGRQWRNFDAFDLALNY